jgi:hypothetical protein
LIFYTSPCKGEVARESGRVGVNSSFSIPETNVVRRRHPMAKALLAPGTTRFGDP